jgi:hypothetical protein
LARQIGGSIGVSVFGAIFTNRLDHEMGQRLPHGMHVPAHTSPALLQQLPAAIHTAYVAAYAAALHPVFITAALVMVAAFGLSWTLHDVPLRETTGAAGLGDGPAPDRTAATGRDTTPVPVSAPASPATMGAATGG